MSRPTVELGGDGVQGGLVEPAQVGALGQVLAEQAVGVLVGATLPRAARIAEEDLDAGVDGELEVFGHLSAVVPGHRAPHLLGQPLNILRLAFHPEGLAPRTVNLAEWSAHLLERLHRQCEATADPELLKLYAELKAYPMPARSGPLSPDNVAIPFKLRRGDEVLSFFSTTMVFGTPVDVTLQELALETFFPADDLTAERMRQIAAGLM